MVPAQPNTWACAWKLSIDFSSLPKGWLRFQASLEGWWNSHNSSHVAFPLVRVDSNICVLPVLVKYNDHSSFFCRAYYLAGSLERGVGDPLGWAGLWVARSSPFVRCEVAWYMEQATNVHWCSCLPLRKDLRFDCSGLTDALGFPCHHPDSCCMWLAGWYALVMMSHPE